MYTDVHCHLNYGQYGDLDRTVKEFLKEGTTLAITSGFDMESSLESKQIAEKYENIYFSAGWQPQELSRYKEGDYEKLKELCLHDKCVAVGEIGLDYHYPDNPEKPFQKRILEEEIELAHSLKLPIVIHSRDSAEDMLEILKQNKSKLINGGVLHCYSHSSEMVKDFLDLNMYFSFGGTSTYKGAKKVIRSAKAVPLDRILSETDSPYLMPEPFKGEFPNTPKTIKHIVKRLAEIRGEDEYVLAETIRNNAQTLFYKLKRD